MTITVDLAAATRFLAGHARVLDRRRAAVLLDGDDGAGALGAVEGYRNADGGYSWGLEPDLRAAESQPGGALRQESVSAPGASVQTRMLYLRPSIDSTRVKPAMPAFAAP